MASFCSQYKALLWRNILIKKRNKRKLFQEFFSPIYCVALLAAIKVIVNPSVQPALQFPAYDINSFKIQMSNMKILVVPNTAKVDAWMHNITSELPGSPSYELFPTAADAEVEYRRNASSVVCGVVFDLGIRKYSYSLRLTYGALPSSDYLFNYKGGTCRSDPSGRSSAGCVVNTYLHTGFAQLQLAIENMILQTEGIKNLTNRSIKVQLMDKEKFTPDISLLQKASSIYFVFSFTFFINYLTVILVTEKEKKIRVGMQMMGLHDFALWLSWGTIYMALVITVSAIIVFIIAQSEFFSHSNLVLIYLMFYLYGMSTITFAFLITPFFKQARTAGAAAGFITVIFSFLYLFVSGTREEGSYDSDVPAKVQYIMCLLSSIAFAACMDKTVFIDLYLGGVDFNETLKYGKFPLYAPILMLVVDIFLYGLLAIYLDHIIPGEYGVRYSPFYPLQLSYWRGTRSDPNKWKISPNTYQSQINDVEPLAPEIEKNVSLSISSLTKSYQVDKKWKNVVNDFNLDIYSSQITCLLGHNGAGKTTLINMLTGVVPPTSGNATIMGLDITNTGDLKKIRRLCGICPQHDILYDMLSCKEHLELFAAIKGVARKDIDSAVTEALKNVDLKDQKDTFAADLSGGQMRKLSVAIALIGDPKLIFLDEPTAGMDPFSRRHLWALLKKKKEGRTILLTTHFMDEADILADRKAFIQKGKLRCCGSSLFLKNKFGIGYHLTMVAKPDCNVERVTAALQSVIPSVEHQRTHGKEIGYTVPLSEVDLFAELFTHLDKNLKELKIHSYGVSMTTLEEVFLKLDEDDEKEEDQSEFNNDINKGKELRIPMRVSIEDKSSLKSSVKGGSLWRQRFCAVLKIRFLLMFRKRRSVSLQLVVPLLMLFGGLYFARKKPDTSLKRDVPIQLKPEIYARNPTKMLLPKFLVFDSLNTSSSQAVIKDLSTSVSVDTYNPRMVNTSDVSPHYIGMQLNSITGKLLDGFTALYNDTAVHSIPVLITTASQNLLNMSGSTAIISAFSWKWPQLDGKVEYDFSVLNYVALMALSFLLSIPGFSHDVISDRELKLRNQLKVAGLNFNLYWGTIYVSNLIMYLIPSVFLLVGILAYQIHGLNNEGAITALVLLLLTNIPFNIVLGLVLSFMFDKAETCISFLPNMIIFAGLIPFQIVMVMDIYATEKITLLFHCILSIIDPCYILYGGFYFIGRVYTLTVIKGREPETSDYLSLGIIVAIVAPLIHMIWGYVLLRVLDSVKTGGEIREAFSCLHLSKRVRPSENNDKVEDEEDDVAAERIRIERIQSSNTQQELVAYVSDLRKEFKKRKTNQRNRGFCGAKDYTTKVAVRNLSFGVTRGEVFGLLGPNGAGKSTAMSMMVAETRPTCGKVVINDQDIRFNVLSLLHSLGYCPQHDALWEVITLEEHIRCFAAIKGIASQNIDSVTDHYISNLQLEEHRKKIAKDLSGGTKRKLSYILSILGNPEFVLMDEPSTGMDPRSKRFMWDTISNTFSDSDRGAILTTHYMEEADAICTRVGIMLNGQLECLGPTQHLKNKYGSGYILEVKLGSHEADQVHTLMDQLEAHLSRMFPDMETVERFMERAQYAIPQENVKSLGQTFALLEECKSSYGVEEYNFSQSSLEQVFLFFAKQQVDDRHDETVPVFKATSKPSLRFLGVSKSDQHQN